MTTVVNKVKDRSKTMSLLRPGVYVYGWTVYNRRDRSKDYFNKAGEGSFEEAQAWMASVAFRVHRPAQDFIHNSQS